MGAYDKEFKSGLMTDRSSTITAGGTAQDVMPANSSRRFILFQNVSDTDMWVNEGADAVAASPSIKIAAGLAFPFTGNFCPTGRISVLCATTGKAFTAKEA